MLWEGEESVGFVKGHAPKERGSETERRESAGKVVVKLRGERVCHFGSGRGRLHVKSGDRLCGGVVLAGGASSATDPACGAQHLDLAWSGEQARPGLVYWTLGETS